MTWVPEKGIFQSVTVNNKHLSGQYALLAQIENVQDKAKLNDTNEFVHKMHCANYL